MIFNRYVLILNIFDLLQCIMIFNIVLILYASGAKISTADTEEETLKIDNEAESESDLDEEISIKGTQNKLDKHNFYIM